MENFGEWGAEHKNLVGGGSTGEIFPGGGKMNKFSAGGRHLPPFFPVGKPIYIP